MSLNKELERLKEREKKLAQEKEKFNRKTALLRKNISEVKRKADTRRKIIAGGTILIMIENDEALKSRVYNGLKEHLKGREKYLFPELG